MTWGELIARDIVPVLASLLLVVATTAIGIGAAYLRRRWQLDVPARVEEQIGVLVAGAVGFAEQWGVNVARTTGKAPIANAKLETAIAWALAEAKRRKLPELARDELVRLLESQIGGERLLRPPMISAGALEPLKRDPS